MNNQLWKNALTICFLVFKKMTNDSKYRNVRLRFAHLGFVIGEATDEQLEQILNIEPAQNTTLLFIDGGVNEESGGNHTKIVMTYSRRTENAQILVLNAHNEPIDVERTTSIQADDPADTLANAIFEILQSTL